MNHPVTLQFQLYKSQEIFSCWFMDAAYLLRIVYRALSLVAFASNAIIYF